MPVRGTMVDIIAKIRLMIADPSGTSFFTDQQVQDACDEHVNFMRYEPLQIAPTIVNTASTGNQAQTIFINYFSREQWWEQDVVLQAYSNGQAWVVVTPTQSDYINGHFWFEPAANEFTSPTVPGQLPPVFCTGKVYDLNWAAADLLNFWGASLASLYDVVLDGQNLRRSQLMAAKLMMAQHYLKMAKPRVAKAVRNDVQAPMDSRHGRLLDSDDISKGA